MKWIIPLLSLAIAGLMIMAAHQSLAATGELAAAPVSKIECHYKEISAKGETQYEARKKVADTCLDSFMAKNDERMGNDPDEIQSDLLVQECVNNTSCK